MILYHGSNKIIELSEVYRMRGGIWQEKITITYFLHVV